MEFLQIGHTQVVVIHSASHVQNDKMEKFNNVHQHPYSLSLRRIAVLCRKIKLVDASNAQKQRLQSRRFECVIIRRFIPKAIGSINKWLITSEVEDVDCDRGECIRHTHFTPISYSALVFPSSYSLARTLSLNHPFFFFLFFFIASSSSSSYNTVQYLLAICPFSKSLRKSPSFDEFFPIAILGCHFGARKYQSTENYARDKKKKNKQIQN